MYKFLLCLPNQFTGSTTLSRVYVQADGVKSRLLEFRPILEDVESLSAEETGNFRNKNDNNFQRQSRV